MSIKTHIKNLRRWAVYCDRTNNGCYASQSLRAAADMLEQYKKRLEEDAAKEVCHFCGVEKCVGKAECPSIVEYVRRVTDGKE